MVIKRIYYLLTVSFVLFLLSSQLLFGAEAHLMMGYIQNASDHDSLHFRTFLTKAPQDTLVKGMTSEEKLLGPVGTTSGWKADYANIDFFYSTVWLDGDSCMTIIDKEDNSGTINHIGYYAVTNDIVDGSVDPQYMEECTLRVIPSPVPVAFADHIDLSWSIPIEDAGNPVRNNVKGYYILRSRKSIEGVMWGIVFPETLNTVVIPRDNPFFTDNTVPAGDTAYYAIRLVYRDTDGSKNPDKLSRYISPNSSKSSVTGISLTGFSSSYYDFAVYLYWRLESSQGTVWSLERSFEREGLYTSIYQIEEGISPCPQEHRYIDRDIISGRTYFYRLKSIDYGGQSSYYGPVSVKVSGGGMEALLQVSPNPMVSLGEIRYAVPKRSNVSLKLYTIVGSVEKTLYAGMREAGYYKVTDWQEQSLSPGIYFLRLESGEMTVTRKLVILR